MVRLLLWATFAAITLATSTTQTSTTPSSCNVKTAETSACVQRPSKAQCPEECKSFDEERKFCNFKVDVGDKDSTQKRLKFFPEEPDEFLCPGRTVDFRFRPANHTVTESSFDEPCKPIAANLLPPNRTEAIKSGFRPTSFNATTMIVFQRLIMDTAPVWIFCGQKTPKSHCGAGMVMAINVVKASSNDACKNHPPTKNTLDAYKQKAMQAEGVSSSSTTSAAAAVTPTDTATAAGPALGTPSATTPLVSVFRGQAAPTAAPAVRYGALGGLAVVGAVALL